MTNITESPLIADEVKQDLEESMEPSVEQELEIIYNERKRAYEEELKWLGQLRIVNESLSDEDNWTTIAVNLCEKQTAMSEQQEQLQDSMESSLEYSKSKGVVGWNSFLGTSRNRGSVLRLQETESRKELQELESQQLVHKSLQDPQHRFEEAASLFFGRKDSRNSGNRMQKRSGNCLVTEQLDDADLDAELQIRVKEKTRSLVDAVFSIESSRRRLHKRLLQQARQPLQPKRLSKSLNLSSSLPHEEAESSDGIIVPKYEKKSKRRKKNYKSSTLPSLKRGGGVFKTANKERHRIRGLSKVHARDYNHETLEEVSEVESVSSTTTLRDAPVNKRISASPASSIAHTSNISPEVTKKISFDRLMLTEDTVTLENGNESSNTDSEQENDDIKQEDDPELAVHNYILTQSRIAMLSFSHPPPPNVIDKPPRVELQKQDSYSSTGSFPDRSLSSSSNLASSIKSTDGEFEEDEMVFDFWSQETKEGDIPSVPPLTGSMVQLSDIHSSSSWLDRYSSCPTNNQRTSSDTTEESAQISDVSFTTHSSDPGITPFIASDVHPLSSDFSDVYFKWRGTNVTKSAWSDPGFREFSNTLDHEPTNEDVVVYKMYELSDEFEVKFGDKLNQIMNEAFVLAIKDQLSYMTFRKLSDKLALEAGVKDGAVLVALLGRNLIELVPSLHQKIMSFTSQAVEECLMVYSTILWDAASGPRDLSEYRLDYDNWTGALGIEEVQRKILMENAPFMGSIDSLVATPTCDQDGLPSFPPDPKLYLDYLQLPRPLIKRSRSVEVLLADDSPVETKEDEPKIQKEESFRSSKFTPPRRTVSESSMAESDTRKSSLNSVFESLKDDDSVTRSVVDPNNSNVIKAESRYEVLSHLEQRNNSSPTHGIVLSTSSTEYSIPRKMYRRISQDSTTSSSSNVSDSDSGRSGSPTKGRKVSGVLTPKFDRIIEESFEMAAPIITPGDHIDEVKYDNITLIKPHPISGSGEKNKTTDGYEETDSDSYKHTGERRRSSAEIIVPTLSLAIPLAALSVIVIKNMYN